MINHVILMRFKQIEEAALPLGPINVLVGGNNSGKSCIRQGMRVETPSDRIGVADKVRLKLTADKSDAFPDLHCNLDIIFQVKTLVS
jgi:predicted ATP-dependent endonuclease of OLD family